MTEAWFPLHVDEYFSFLALLAVCALFNIPARRGRLRGLAVAVWNGMLALGVLLYRGRVAANHRRRSLAAS